ncbi:TIGR02466 family protein [Paucibacter sp. Y2R2-4]|uniref:TIGR02466 family protein n=1 Tax=Paucibacter sp. Y2R2-4 TaxID=2893553 RepID=UPI0021E380EC|nr:TIGR02466 family protein [Paucibacter sp. Y2R2-4]MCV2351270.1 TIGR02466 family protein [Paucibacter sp. Y2R2-4]
MTLSLNLHSIEPLFFTPLVKFELVDANALNRQLLAEAHARRTASAGLARSNIDGWHSEDDFFEREEPGSLALRGQIIEAVRQATLQLSPHYDFNRFGIQAEGWINILPPGGMNAPHDHPGWVWSGCYYVHTPDGDGRSGEIEFIDSRTNLRTLSIEGAPCFASKFSVRPSAGQLLLFPSYLKHWVAPNRGVEERVSIAFNARFARRR